jgi:tetratricopeptide (TPR) repeat protein
MKQGKKKKTRAGSNKTPVAKVRRKSTVFGRLLLVLFGFSLLAMGEIVLRLLPLTVDSAVESDPFVGFSKINPLFIPYRADNGSARMKTAPDKLRWFNTQDFTAVKESGTFRIFTLGGSTTYGRPYKDATSFSGWLRALLNRTTGFPVRYEVINTGGISYASYRVVTVLEELLDYQPDLLIVYTGHNEFLEARTYGDLVGQSETLFKIRNILSRLKTYRWLRSTYKSFKKSRAKSSEARSAEGKNILAPEVQTILDQSAGLDLYQRDTLFSRGVFEHFRYNVARMKRLCRQAGVPVVFLEPVDNIKDFSPFKSQGLTNLDAAGRERMMQAVIEGGRFLGEGQSSQAVERFKEAVAIDSLYADCFFYLGRACLEAGDTAAAAEYLLQAREQDVCPLRAQEPIHKILRQESAGKNAPDLLVLPNLFRELSPGGIIGKEMLLDHIHPQPAGHMQIALWLLKWMNEEGLIQGDIFPGADEIDNIYREGMDSLPPAYFSKGIVNLAKVLFWAEKYGEALSVLNSRWEELAEEGEARYLAGAALLELGVQQEALIHLQKALELAPDHIMVLLKLAPLYSRLGEIDSSIATYERAIALYPDNNTLLSGYSMVLTGLGKTDEALKYLHRAYRLDPDSPELNNNLGTVYAMAGNHSRALEFFNTAKDLTPDNPSAYYNLGNLYVMQKDMQEAEKYFLEAIRIDPGHFGAMLNLGNIYQNTNRFDLAEKQFNLILGNNPNLLEPYISLAGLYRSTGKTDRAREVTELGLQHFPEDQTLKSILSEIEPK